MQERAGVFRRVQVCMVGRIGQECTRVKRKVQEGAEGCKARQEVPEYVGLCRSMQKCVETCSSAENTQKYCIKTKRIRNQKERP